VPALPRVVNDGRGVLFRVAKGLGRSRDGGGGARGPGWVAILPNLYRLVKFPAETGSFSVYRRRRARLM